jgi:hypothetical protein
MGCDIHAIVEYDEYKDGKSWTRFCNPNLPRSYSTFGVLAGVRSTEFSPLISPRGLPDHYSNYYEDNYVGDYVGDHTFAWLTPGEFRKALELLKLKDYQPHVEYLAVADLMDRLAIQYPVRIVFGFDS